MVGRTAGGAGGAQPWDAAPSALLASARAVASGVQRSLVSLGESGFWEYDNLIELWLFCLAREADASPTVSPWLRRLREVLVQVAASGLDGRELRLSDVLTLEAQLAELAAVASAALDRLEGRAHAPASLTVDYWRSGAARATTLEALLEREGETTSRNLLDTGRQFQALLRGALPAAAGENQTAGFWPSRS